MNKLTPYEWEMVQRAVNLQTTEWEQDGTITPTGNFSAATRERAALDRAYTKIHTQLAPKERS